ILTPGYFDSSAKESAGQSERRVSSISPKRPESGVLGASKHGSLIKPLQRQSRSAFFVGSYATILSRSKAPKVLAVIPSQKRSLPPVHKSQVFRPLISSGVSATPPSISWK